MRVALDPAMLSARPPSATFEAAAAAGYAYVELGNRPDLIPAFGRVVASRGELARLRRLAAAAGTTVASVAVIQAWSSPDEARRLEAIESWRDGINCAIELGCTRINTELSGDPDDAESSRTALLRSFEALVPVIEREGVTIRIEPHPGDFIETTEAALRILEEVGSDALAYLHCIPHTYYLGGSLTSQVALVGRRLDHVHLADTFRPDRLIVNPSALPVRVHAHFDIDAGEIDWPEVAVALRSVGFDGLLTVQVFGWAERAEESFRRNRSAVARYFGAEIP